MYLAPFCMLLFLASIQMIVSLFLRSSLTFTLMLGILVASAYIKSPYLVGNLGMFYRSAWAAENGIGTGSYMAVVFGLCAALWIVGGIIFCRRDIQKREELGLMEKPMIYMEHVTKKIGGNVILQDVNLNLEPGCVYGIEGTNGSGKTMLMRMIAGLIYPTQGKVLIQGKEISGAKAYPVNLGMLIENPAFLDGYTGLNNLKFLASINQRVTEQEIRNTITRVGLDADDTRKYKKYSLGMKQRLGIAAAIFEHPDILILDEPVNALDEDGVALVQQIIEEEKQRGALILLSCHDREFLEGASDVLYRMKAGVLSEMLGEVQG